MLEYSLVNTIAHKAKMGQELLSRFMAVEDSDTDDNDTMSDADKLKKQASNFCTKHDFREPKYSTYLAHFVSADFWML